MSTTSTTPKTWEHIVRELAMQKYFHGLVLREDIVALLRNEGEFLIRFSESRKGEKAFILSTMVQENLEKGDGIKHFLIIQTQTGKYMIETWGFKTIPEMITFFLKGNPVTKDGKVKITTPVKRQFWEHCHENILLGKRLGEGAFAKVSSGILRIKSKPTSKRVNNSKGSQGGQMRRPSLKSKMNMETVEIQVAVKIAKMEKITKEQIIEIMSEARLMRRLTHQNVVKFYGVATMQEPLMVIMELCTDGALDAYIRKNQPPIDKRNEMVMQAAWGLEYLHKNLIIHRDIAARNCLYTNGQVKIADFGLSREGTTYQMDGLARVPIRWLAPECITTAIFSLKTDVWAFGVMAWEIYTDAEEPYAGKTLAEVKQAVAGNNQLRLKFRDGISPDVSDYICQSIWSQNPDNRPLMPAVVQKFEQLFQMTFSGTANCQK